MNDVNKVGGGLCAGFVWVVLITKQKTAMYVSEGLLYRAHF